MYTRCGFDRKKIAGLMHNLFEEDSCIGPGLIGII